MDSLTQLWTQASTHSRTVATDQLKGREISTFFPTFLTPWDPVSFALGDPCYPSEVGTEISNLLRQPSASPGPTSCSVGEHTVIQIDSLICLKRWLFNTPILDGVSGIKLGCQAYRWSWLASIWMLISWSISFNSNFLLFYSSRTTLLFVHQYGCS